MSAIRWFMNQIGYAVCHQFAERSLVYSGQKLPVCARDTGFFLCFTACFAVLLIVYGRGGNRYPSWKTILVLALFIVPTAVDAITSYAGLRESTNAIRLMTGGLAGVGAAGLLFPLACEQLFRIDDGAVVLERWWSPLYLVPIPVLIGLALWPDWPGAYWVWAPLVTLSILFMLIVLNTTLFSLVWDWVRKGASGPSGATIALVGFGATVVEIVVANRLHWLVDRFL